MARVMVAYTGALAGLDAADLFTLPHPSSGKPTMLTVANGHLLQFAFFKSKHSAWLAGDCMLSDGALHLATPVDPLFFLLPLVPRASSATAATPRAERYVEAEELLQCDTEPEYQRLLPLVSATLRCICESKDAGGDTYYRFSQVRALAWLRCKVNQAQAALASEVPCPLPLQPAAAKSYATGMVCELLASCWEEDLMQALHGDFARLCKPLSELNAPYVPHDSSQYEPELKKAKVQVGPNLEQALSIILRRCIHLQVQLAPVQKAAVSREISRQANFAKSAKGSSSIKSFFGKGKS